MSDSARGSTLATKSATPPVARFFVAFFRLVFALSGLCRLCRLILGIKGEFIGGVA